MTAPTVLVSAPRTLTGQCWVRDHFERGAMQEPNDTQETDAAWKRFRKSAARQVEKARRRNEDARVMDRALELAKRYPVLSPGGAIQMARNERGR